MFIQTEDTPNPATMKFLPGRAVMGACTADFPTPESTERSPLATSLFNVAHVSAVFLGSDFVAVTKDDEGDWQLMKPAVLGVIMEHFITGRPVIEGEADAVEEDEIDPEDQEVVAQIKELLETRVRPAVAMDGGDITFKGFRQGVVFLAMQGACQGCPSSTMTLKMGIENLLKHYVPQVQEVRPVM